MSHRTRGFTLIELLVVIAIIAILAAILFPVFAQAREKARAISCLSNTKQLATAAMMYVQDYDETFFWNPWPGGCPDSGGTDPKMAHDHWAVMIYPYTKNAGIYGCPDYTGVTYYSKYPFVNKPDGTSGLYVCGDATQKIVVPTVKFGLNEVLFGGHDPVSLAAVQSPASIGMMVDNNYLFSYWNCMVGPQDSKVRAYFPEGRNSVDYYQSKPRHSGGMNFAFADGHSKYGKSSDTPDMASRSDAQKGYYNVLQSDKQFDTVAACEADRGSGNY